MDVLNGLTEFNIQLNLIVFNYSRMYTGNVRARNYNKIESN